MTRNFFHSLMTDKNKNIVFAPLKGLLYVLSLLYGAAIFLRKLLYRSGIFRTSEAPMKVISVGNLTLGGTGKTPFVMMLSRLIRDEFKKEAGILIRGYGWDEQTMLKNALADIPVVVGEDRVKSARRAIKLYGTNTAILDDGFQYWELKRDLDIVLVDSRNPFGNGCLFPRGILREPKAAVERANIVVFTKIDKKTVDTQVLRNEFKNINPGLIFLEAVHKPRHLYDNRTKAVFAPEYLKGRRVILLSSIGDPGYFKETVKDLGADVAAHIRFGDHHNYTPGDIEKIKRICAERRFEFMLTTEKDAVKLNRLALTVGDYTLMVLSVEMAITFGREVLIARLHSLYTG